MIPYYTAYLGGWTKSYLPRRVKDQIPKLRKRLIPLLDLLPS